VLEVALVVEVLGDGNALDIFQNHQIVEVG
jgi:hypothetical protein